MVRKLLLILSLLLPSCATPLQSTLLGAAVGTVVSGTLSLWTPQGMRPMNEGIVGASAGAVFGGLAGYFGPTKEVVKQSPIAEPLLGEFDEGESAPLLSTPKMRKIWIPDRVDGVRYEKGHWMYIIQKEQMWKTK